MDKKVLRNFLKEKRINLSSAYVEDCSFKIFEHLKGTNISNYNNILVYSDFKNEVKTGVIIDYLLSEGKRVYLPKCNTEDKTFVPLEIKTKKFNSIINKYGIDEPQDSTDGFSEIMIDCVIAPGIAFDEKGNRIGFGAGYYDKFLSKNKSVLKIGLCYEFQIVRSIESCVYDIPMNIVITEKRIINCQSRENQNSET